MTHPILAKDLKKDSPEYKRTLYMVTALVFGLCAFGGALLGYRINQNEAAIAKQQAEFKKNPEKFKNIRRPPKPW